jgi:hypothetical protein
LVPSDWLPEALTFPALKFTVPDLMNVSPE